MKIIDTLRSSFKVFFFINIKQESWNLYKNVVWYKVCLLAILVNIVGVTLHMFSISFIFALNEYLKTQYFRIIDMFAFTIVGDIFGFVIGLLFIGITFLAVLYISLIVYVAFKLLGKKILFSQLYFASLAVYSIYWIIDIAYINLSAIIYLTIFSKEMDVEDITRNFFLWPLLMYNIVVYALFIKNIYQQKNN